MSRKGIVLGWTLCLSLLSANVLANEEVDPWQGFNQAIFSFNETLDEYLLLPVTRGYKAVMPDPVEEGVHNVFSNLGDFGSLANNLFQLKFHNAAQDTARVVANTFFGIFGVFDVATPLGLPKQGEDFGQTLGYWGVGTGPYLVLPLFGPSNIRDGLSMIPDSRLDPLYYVDSDDGKYLYYALRAIDTRSELMKSEKLITGDRYSFIRDAYLQRREYLVNDGEVSDSFGEDGF